MQGQEGLLGLNVAYQNISGVHQCRTLLKCIAHTKCQGKVRFIDHMTIQEAFQYSCWMNIYYIIKGS